MSPDLYLVLHLPKTAGSTLHANFRPNFKKSEWLPLSPSVDGLQRDAAAIKGAVDREIARFGTPRTRCAFGHWVYWGVHEGVRPDARPRYITFLRDPVERCISLFGYIKTRPDSRAHDSITRNRWSIGEWLVSGGNPELFNGQLRRVLFDGSNDVLLEPNLTRDHLEAAKERLRAFWFVGLTETFESDALFLYGSLNFWCLLPPRVVNATPHKAVVSPEERHALAAANRLDLELFEFARQLHSDWLRDNASEVRKQQRRARILKRIWTPLQPLYGAKHKLKQLRPSPTGAPVA